MPTQHAPNPYTIEVFAAACSACDGVTELVNRIAAPGSQVRLLDMHDADVSTRAKGLGLKSMPSVVIDGRPASSWCAARGVDEATLRMELA